MCIPIKEKVKLAILVVGNPDWTQVSLATGDQSIH